MTPLQIATFALFAVTAAVALALAKKDERNRPVAWYLAAEVVIVLVRYGLRQLLPATPPAGPVEGSILLIRHGEQAAYLGHLMLLPAMTMALYLRRRPWVIGVLYVVVLAVLIAGYPAIRGAELLRIYTAIELAGGIVSVGFFITWLRSPRLTEEGASAPIMSGLALTAGSLATVVLPPLTGPGVLEKWSIVVALHAVSLGFALVYQLRSLLAEGQQK